MIDNCVNNAEPSTKYWCSYLLMYIIISAGHIIGSPIYLLHRKNKSNNKKVDKKFDSIDFSDLGENTEYVSYSVSIKITIKKEKSKNLFYYNLYYIDRFRYMSTYSLNLTEKM